MGNVTIFACKRRRFLPRLCSKSLKSNQDLKRVATKMSVATAIKAQLETAKTTDHTGVGENYATLGTPLSEPAQCLIITSTLAGEQSGVSCWLSVDGTNDHIFVPPSYPLVIDIAGNKQGCGKLSFVKGTQFYIKQGPDGAPTSGDLAISAIYGR